MAYNELEQEAAVIPNNLKFCISGDVEPFVKFATAGKINGVDYAYRCLDVKPNSGAKAELGLSQLVNSMRSRLDQILENI